MPFPFLAAAIAANTVAGIGSSLSKKSSGDVDISGELSKIRDLFSQARESARAGINQEFDQRRGLEASNLAARGIYSSPVSQNVFNALNSARFNAISQSEGQIAGQEAQTRSSLLNALLGYKMHANELKDQRNAALWGQLGSLGSLLLLNSGGSGGVGGAGSNPAAPYTGPLSRVQSPNDAYSLFPNLLKR